MQQPDQRPSTAATTDSLVDKLRRCEEWYCFSGLSEDVEALLVALQTCLHLLGEDGYIPDPDYPEVAEALALYERLVGV